MEFVEILKVIILGIVEGITEWLPISSTGHMILVDEFIKLNMSGAFMEMFLVVIQLGAIMAVVVLYFEKLLPFSIHPKPVIKEDTMILWFKILVASIPVMFGASLIKILKFGLVFTGNEIVILVTGMVVVYIVSVLAIKFLVGYIQKHDFKVFGWYRIVLGIIVILYFALG